MEKTYNASFYSGHSEGSERSAHEVLPILFDIYHPNSIVDFGCGVGTWLKAAHDLGVKQLRGYEGSWVRPDLLVFPQMELINASVGQPIKTDRFDLAMCMEVAEHLRPDQGPALISNLCKSSDVVLFSAAILRQGGTDHINEQKQSFWADHFHREGFDCFDPIRPRIWNNSFVEYWYRQNVLLYVKKGASLIDRTRLGPEAQLLDVVHPAAFEIAQKYARSSVRRFLHHCRQRLQRH